MTPIEARKLWCDALRSGEFQQGLNYLVANSHYCCLGVACELYCEHVEKLPAKISEGTTTYCELHSATLPPAVAKWLDITETGSLIYDLPHSSGWRLFSLADCNDSAKMSFAAIADIIEAGNLKPFEGTYGSN